MSTNKNHSDEGSTKNQLPVAESMITPENTNEVISKVMLLDVNPIIVDLDKSKGQRIYDAKGKRFYLDCFSYVASNPIGHNHPGMFEPEFEKKLLRAARGKPASSDFHTVEMAEFVDTFRRLAMKDIFKHLFLIEGGSNAVENALKVAFDWKVRLNQSKGVPGEKGTKVIHFEQAFHGRGGYTLSLTNTADPKKTKFFPKFEWPRIINPKIHFPLDEESKKKVEALEQKAYSQIEAAFAEQGNDLAAIIIETAQGEGGDNQFRKEFFQGLRKIADEKDLMLIFDEVQCGVGLTGKMWAFEHYGVIPDIVCFGKKMQVCGIMVSDRVDQVQNNVFKESSRINSTWGGNLVDMVRAQRYLEIIEKENLVENARVVGDYFQAELINLSKKYPALYSNARGLGLMCAIDLTSTELRDKVHKTVFEMGAIILKCGENSLRFRPALNYTKNEIDLLVRILEDATKAVLG